ncbi:MAG: hypothetical protein H0T47_07390 [Planctomycetaceae bacterium]|nr:hypothetical protein [Planctomycetaceae bacterium]
MRQGYSSALIVSGCGTSSGRKASAEKPLARAVEICTNGPAFSDTPIRFRNRTLANRHRHQTDLRRSEGEQRVVVVSAFLAELSIAEDAVPIIFDDPVSSLDHLFRERVAKRLVREAKQGRQVVVFTHDIVTLLAIEDECGKHQVPLQVQTVRRSASGPGECPESPSRPWHASSTKVRIGVLKNDTARFRKLSVQSPEEYRVAVAEAFGKLREAWERAIEEHLLNDAVQRFKSGIETQRLKKVSVETSDYVVIYDGMSKCTAELTGHDQAPAKASAVPSPDDVADAITTLESFITRITARQSSNDKNASNLTKPPVPSVSNGRAAKVISTAPLTKIVNV